MLCKYLLGSVLILWEFILNTQAGLNLAVIYSFTGRFDLATQVLDTRLALLYIPIYFFAIWDSRRIAIDLNKFAILAERKGSTLQQIKITSLEVNYLSIRKPIYTVIWSFLCPGLGHIYINRLFTGLYAVSYFVICVYFSNVLPALLYLIEGGLKQSVASINPEWFLFLPSLYGFSVSDSFTNAIEYNRLFKMEQAQYLENTFQPASFPLHVMFKKE
ncbi:hypothetical protein ABFG93_15375 [Pseudalkalibacillus hwajinpoensis]|uniref:hypothetical protein n=1 Tax=Guptibacillus hwajinpoensis TaxID=208199 RepID=UPI00325B51BD